MSDPIDAAIEQAAQPRQVEMVTANATVNSTGRPFAVTVPAGLTHEEALAVCGFVSQLPDQLGARRPASRILVPRPM